MTATTAKFKVNFSVKENGRNAPQWTINSDLNGEQTIGDLLAFTKRNLIFISDFALRDEQTRGFDKAPIVAVDGRVGKAVINVNPLGKIEFTSKQNIAEIARAIYEGIEHRSPVDTGKYFKSHYVVLNRTQVANDRTSLEKWLATNPQLKPGDLLYFVNVQPYARKLERLGITAQKRTIRVRKEKRADRNKVIGGGVLAPNGAYFLTARSINSRYKRNARIAFKYLLGSFLGLSGSFLRSQSKGSKKNPRPYLYPAIVVLIGEKGLL